MAKKPKVLIVEDDEALRKMYEERFKNEKMDVLTVEDGQAATEVALREIPDIILLDLFLPKKGGLSVLEVLKSQPHTKDIPVIILTAYPREEYKDKGTRNGAVMFLSKSETMPGEVVEKVKEIVKID